MQFFSPRKLCPGLGGAALFAGLALALGLGGVARAQAVPAVVRIAAPPVHARTYSGATAIFRVEVENGYHIQSHHPVEDYLIPTRLTIAPAAGIALVGIKWPPAVQQRFSFSQKPLTVFQGTFNLPIRLKTGPGGDYVLHGIFAYQACTDQVCRPPVQQPFTIEVIVAK